MKVEGTECEKIRIVKLNRDVHKSINTRMKLNMLIHVPTPLCFVRNPG